MLYSERVEAKMETLLYLNACYWTKSGLSVRGSHSRHKDQTTFSTLDYATLLLSIHSYILVQSAYYLVTQTTVKAWFNLLSSTHLVTVVLYSFKITLQVIIFTRLDRFVTLQSSFITKLLNYVTRLKAAEIVNWNEARTYQSTEKGNQILKVITNDNTEVRQNCS